MRATSRRLVFLALGPALLTGCFYPADRGKQIEARVEKLEAEKGELEAALKAQQEKLDAQVPKLDEKVAEVGQALEKLDKASRRTGADIGVQMEQVQTDLSALRGKVDDYLHRIGEMETALASMKEAADKTTASGQKPEGVKKAEEKPTDKKGLAEYIVAKAESDAETARRLAPEWLKKYPKDPLAAKVYHALGMSYLAEQNWRAALGQFKEVIENFAKSEQAPDALLKSGDCFASLKMMEESRLALEEILHSYPKSPAAEQAKAKLDALKKAPKGKKK